MIINNKNDPVAQIRASWAVGKPGRRDFGAVVVKPNAFVAELRSKFRLSENIVITSILRDRGPILV